LNIKADLIAKQKASMPHTGPICYKLPGNPWGCYVDNQCIVKQLNLKIQAAINRRETMDSESPKEIIYSYIEASQLVIPRVSNENGSIRETKMGIKTNVGSFRSWKKYGQMETTNQGQMPKVKTHGGR